MKVNQKENLSFEHEYSDYQNEASKKSTQELILAHSKIAFQNEENKNLSAKLIIANQEINIQNTDKDKKAAELVIINNRIAFKNREREFSKAELNIANRELKKAAQYHKEYIQGLEDILFIVSHKVRQPIAHILGISKLLEYTTIVSADDLKKMVNYTKSSAISLDAFTKELSDFLTELQNKGTK
jgi:signal transduction histidine kinase